MMKHIHSTGRGRGINRYMLGCKFSRPARSFISARELIDTCWDVNTSIRWQMKRLEKELIDTCWDVNMILLIVCNVID